MNQYTKQVIWEAIFCVIFLFLVIGALVIPPFWLHNQKVYENRRVFQEKCESPVKECYYTNNFERKLNVSCWKANNPEC